MASIYFSSSPVVLVHTCGTLQHLFPPPKYCTFSQTGSLSSSGFMFNSSPFPHILAPQKVSLHNKTSFDAARNIIFYLFSCFLLLPSFFELRPWTASKKRTSFPGFFERDVICVYAGKRKRNGRRPYVRRPHLQFFPVGPWPPPRYKLSLLEIESKLHLSYLPPIGRKVEKTP